MPFSPNPRGEPTSESARLLEILRRRDPHEAEFLQAADEVLASLEPVFERDPRYVEVMERLVEPERVISFRVAWLDDKGKQRVNRGFRVQFNSALGPFKGGLRFHPSVNLGIIKFLGFEQIFKNSLTTLPMGGGKGGSDFDPKGKSDAEVQRFCQSFMTELSHHIGPSTDVPAGDIGVGGREIGYLFGQYRRMHNRVDAGVLTGKSLEYGGSLIRPEATGYGCVYFAQEMLADLKTTTLKGKVCAVSGSGNVCQYTLEKLLDLGAIPTSCSDSNGTLYAPGGISRAFLAEVMDLKNNRRGRLAEFELAKFPGTTYHAGKKPWEIAEKAECVFPSATQNEVNKSEAEMLVKKGCICVSEGANMPCDAGAIAVFKAAKVAYGPGKAANAGGVAVSGLEMSQNSMRLSWTREKVDSELHDIMKSAYASCKQSAEEYGVPGDVQTGANIAGFLKVAHAMMAQGCI